MNFLARQAIRPPRSGETVFRISPWGPLFTCLIFLIALLVGVALFIYIKSALDFETQRRPAHFRQASVQGLSK